MMPMPIGSAAPPLHLLKMAVGIGDIGELRRVRAERTKELGGSWVRTRNHPRRAAEILVGAGSLYWVIRGEIRARQRIVGFTSAREDNGRGYCLIAVDRELVSTLARRWRPFQGWRYLAPADAPPDMPSGADAPGPAEVPMPPRLIAELRALGLL
jgi:hypothetical protein